MSKKTLFLTILLLIIALVGLIFGVLTFYRFYVIQNLYGKIHENVKKDNYYMKTIIKTADDSTSTTEAYYREGVGKLVAENGVYTWVDGEYAYMVDEENKQVYVLNIENENLGLVSYDMFANIVPGYNKNIFNRLFIAGNLKNTIEMPSSSNSNSYIIKTSDKTATKTIWLNEKGTPYKGEVLFKNGEKVTYEYDIKFNNVTLKNIELPRIDSYKIIDADTKETVLDNTNNINSNATDLNNTSNVTDLNNTSNITDLNNASN